MNYGELKTAVQNISHRDYSTYFPTWIELIEGTLARNLRAADMLRLTQLTESERDSTYSEVYDLPAATFLEARLVKISGENGRVIEPVGLNAVYGYRRSTRVWGYALVETANVPQIAFIGTPATDSEFDVLYYAKQVLNTAADGNTNEILTNHAELYVHGLLFYTYQRSQDLELAQVHADQLTEAMVTINEQTSRFLGGTVLKAPYNLGNFMPAYGSY